MTEKSILGTIRECNNCGNVYCYLGEDDFPYMTCKKCLKGNMNVIEHRYFFEGEEGVGFNEQV